MVGSIRLLLRFVALLLPAAALANAPPVENLPGAARAVEPFPRGAQIWQANCAACHNAGLGRTPQEGVLRFMTPEAVHTALTRGAMRQQALHLSDSDRIEVAQYLGGRALASSSSAPPLKMCQGAAATFDLNQPPAFAGWGLDAASTHALPSKRAGITRRNVAQLKLKWAFGFPGANRARSQPAIAAGAVFVGSHGGTVYALDRETGCVRWAFDASSEVRTGIVISPWRKGDAKARPLAFFGDWTGSAYAVEALTGKLVWKVRADDHPAAVITGTPSLHRGTLYVPVSSLEEAAAASPNYECCTFRGSVLALDAATGAERWRTWLVDEPRQTRKTTPGTSHFGPSGVAVWNSPAIDSRRGQLYIATGDNYTEPATGLSDAIVAIDLDSGTIKWHYQATQGDAWNVACILPTPGNCPEDAGPDFDFGAGTVLARGRDGRDVVLAGQKSGIAYGVDPDSGRLIWQTRAGRGGMAGGIQFGLAAVAGRVYVPVSDMADGQPSDFPQRPGVHALDVASGKPIWSAASPDTCQGRKLCMQGYSGAVMATPELVFAGSDDGFIRVFNAASGKLMWESNTDRTFDTVNGVPGHGGAISGGAAPIALDGQLIVSSGYGFVSKLPGNVMLVFEAE